jgi:hypothetical protein
VQLLAPDPEYWKKRTNIWYFEVKESTYRETKNGNIHTLPVAHDEQVDFPVDDA